MPLLTIRKITVVAAAILNFGAWTMVFYRRDKAPIEEFAFWMLLHTFVDRIYTYAVEWAENEAREKKEEREEREEKEFRRQLRDLLVRPYKSGTKADDVEKKAA